jgi:hypothetical protein
VSVGLLPSEGYYEEIICSGLYVWLLGGHLFLISLHMVSIDEWQILGLVEERIQGWLHRVYKLSSCKQKLDFIEVNAKRN